jgi:hypothetical protein
VQLNDVGDIVIVVGTAAQLHQDIKTLSGMPPSGDAEGRV